MTPLNYSIIIKILIDWWTVKVQSYLNLKSVAPWIDINQGERGGKVGGGTGLSDLAGSMMPSLSESISPAEIKSQ